MRAIGYLTDSTSGTLRMYSESARLYRRVMLNSVTGRSCSMTVVARVAVTSVIHGDAASWRRNVVYAWMSTVRPSIDTRVSVAEPASAGAGPVVVPVVGGVPTGALVGVWICVIWVYGGTAFVISSSRGGKMKRSAWSERMIVSSAASESRARSACRFWAAAAS